MQELETTLNRLEKHKLRPVTRFPFRGPYHNAPVTELPTALITSLLNRKSLWPNLRAALEAEASRRREIAEGPVVWDWDSNAPDGDGYFAGRRVGDVTACYEGWRARADNLNLGIFESREVAMSAVQNYFKP